MSIEHTVPSATDLSDPRRTGRGRRLGALGLGAAAAVLALASPAGAMPSDGGYEPDPTPSPTPADLSVTASRVVDGGSTWNLSYTVKNVGGSPPGRSSTAQIRRAGSVLASVSVPNLAAGASITGTYQLPKSGTCYGQLGVVADATGVVAEKSEANNQLNGADSTTTCMSTPTYKVKALTLKAVTETHDWAPGSDEPYVIFGGLTPQKATTAQRSQEFGDVDTGETRTFASTEGCMYGSGSTCSGVPAPKGIAFTAGVWEGDLQSVATAMDDIKARVQAIPGWPYVEGYWYSNTPPQVHDAWEQVNGWFADDLIGEATRGLSLADLANAVPNPGSRVVRTMRLQGASTGAGGVYDLTYEVVRTS